MIPTTRESEFNALRQASNCGRITTKVWVNYQMVWQLLAFCPKFKVCLEAAGAKVMIETKAPIAQTANSGANQVATKERCIYPNLKLRVYTTGMRQNRLAKLVGIDEAYLSRIINGVRTPGKQMQEQIAQVLDCDTEWLFQQTTIQVPAHSNGNSQKLGTAGSQA